jgi:Protein of unknown function (DUF3105)
MAHRKGEKEALRRQREEREAQARAEQQRKRLAGYGGAAALVAAAVVVVLLLAGGGGNGGGPAGEGDFFPEGGDAAEQRVFDLEEAASAAGCELTSTKGSGVQTHTQSLDEKVNYKDNPPTTGRHYVTPAEDGVYAGRAPQDEFLVHALEHGRVIIWVKPTVPRDARASVRAMVEEQDYLLVLVQRREMPYALAATAWNADPPPGGTGRTLGCDEWNPEVLDALRAFRDQHVGNGPEPFPEPFP